MEKDLTRVVGIDPGDKRIGIAISDPTRTIASPLSVITHISREEDARAILAICEENQAGLILIGQAVHWDGEVSLQGEKSAKLAEAIQTISTLPVVLWDEYGSTQAAQESRKKMNLPKKKRKGHHDQIAATIILQSYLDSQPAQEEI